jgi:hypothetical protein
VYHVQSLGFFGVEGEMNDGVSAPTARLDKMRDWYYHYAAPLPKAGNPARSATATLARLTPNAPQIKPCNSYLSSSSPPPSPDVVVCASTEQELLLEGGSSGSRPPANLRGAWQGSGNKRSPTPRSIHGTLDESRVIAYVSLAHTFSRCGRYAHLEALGVTVVYFGPLFESSDLGHGYDTADYMSVDRRLGSSRTFAEVVAELAARGIQVRRSVVPCTRTGLRLGTTLCPI